MAVYERQIDAYDDIEPDQLIDQPIPYDPSTGDLFGALWGTSATKGAWDMLTGEEYETEPDFDPNWKTLDPRYDHIYPELKKAKSSSEFRHIQRMEDQKQADYEIIAKSGTEGMMYSFAAGALDPITLPLWFVPVTKGFQAAGTLGKMARMTGYATADMAARETIMHQVHPGYSADETMKTMLLTASAASAFGALAGFATRKASDAARIKAQKEAEWNANVTHDSAMAARHDSAGSMAVRSGQGAELSMEMPMKGQKWFHTISIKAPGTRMAMTPFKGLAEPAAIVSELAYTGVMKAKYAKNIADDFSTPVDVMVRQSRQTSEAAAMDAIKIARTEIKKNHGLKMSANEIATAMERGVVYGDDTIRYPELLPYIHQERAFRKNLLDRMKRAGMVSDDMTFTEFNKHYGPRLYDHNAVRNNTSGWVKGVKAGYRAKGDTRTDDELLKRALDGQRNIGSVSKTGQAASFGIGSQPARLKSITMKIDDDYIEEFFIRDIRKARDTLNRQLLPELILRERYGQVIRTDDGLEVPALTKRLKDEFEKKQKKLVKAGKNKEAEDLLKTHERNLLDMQHILKKLSGLGEFNTILTPKVAGFLNELRSYAGASWLGNSMIASLHEPMRVALEHGFAPMIRGAAKVAFPKGATKQFVEQMRSFGVGLELRTHGSTAVLRADIDDPGMLPTGVGSMAQRHLAPAMYKYNGQNWFNQTFKTGAATTHGDQLVRYALHKQAARAGSAEEKMTRARFAQLGIGTPELNRLNEMAKKGFVQQEDGVYFIDLEGMTDKTLARKLGDSMMMVADSTIVTPGVGSLPIMLDNQLGRMLTQFRNVFFNMQGKTIMPTASRIAHGDMRAVRGLTAMMAQTWLIYQIRLAGRVGYDPDKFEEEWNKMSFQDHMREMIEASGMTGLTMEMFSMADQAVDGNLSRLSGMNEGSKSYHGLASSIPAVSWGTKVSGAALSGMTEDGFTQADANALGYSMPMRTVWYLDPILDKIQESTVEQLPDGDQRKRNYKDRVIRY